MTNWDEIEFYKAFTPAKPGTKQPLWAYTKTENQLTYEQCRERTDILALLANNAVMYEADDKENSDKLLAVIQGEKLPCFVTDRDGGKGVHSLFINDGSIKSNATKVTLACGFEVDIKVGCRNGLEAVKHLNTERKIVYDSKCYQKYPRYFTPIKTTIDFLNMEAGDGRNQALFNYILTLQGNDFTIEEIRECLRIINTYIFKDPMSEKELEIISRDAAFLKPVFFKGTKFQHDVFGKYLIRENKIISIYEQIHIYENGIYTENLKSLHRCMIEQINNITKNQRNETLSYMETMAADTELSDIIKIPVKNGLYNLETGELEGFTPLYVSKNLIPVAYNPEAYDPEIDGFLNGIACNDQEIRALIEEMIGCCIYRSNAYQAIFILTGIGANGKSTLLKLLTMMLGIENISSVDLKDLEKTFKPAELFGKLANIGDDISSEQIRNSSFVKKLSSGERSNVEKKGKNPFEFNSYATLIFSCNIIPKINDNTNGLSRRLIFIPFKNVFECDPAYEKNLLQAERLDYLLKTGIEGLQRYLKNNGFTQSSEVEKTKEDYLISNNPVNGFLNDIEPDEILNEPTDQVFLRFKNWCDANSHNYPYDLRKFSKDINHLTGFQTQRIRPPKKSRYYGKQDKINIFVRKDD